MTKLAVALRNFANAPKKSIHVVCDLVSLISWFFLKVVFRVFTGCIVPVPVVARSKA